jgi:hypothetical protein
MAYKKITVDDKEYLYQIGKKIVKIRHDRHAKSTFFDMEKFGEKFPNYESCSCGGGYNCNAGDPSKIIGYGWRVGPQEIEAMIRSKYVA